MLRKCLQNYVKEGIYPFHMPGHKSNPDFLPKEILLHDLTEIPGLDNLYEPTGPILRTQERIAAICGAQEAVLLTNGSTAGIVAAIAGTVGDGETIVMDRGSHRSAFGALALSGALPAYAFPRSIGGLDAAVDAEAVMEAISANPNAKAVYVTSPVYGGCVADIRSIADAAHIAGMILLVDEAHGAHFPFHPIFPEPAMSCGADVAVNSAHKTLPAMSQSSVLLFSGGLCDRERIKRMLRCVQTSSPSYALMSQMDYVYARLSEDPGVFEEYARRLAAFRRRAGGLSARLVEPGRETGAFGCDKGKLLFAAPEGLDGFAMERILRDEFKVQLELGSERLALAMTSPADTDEGFERLARGIEALSLRHPNEASMEGPAPFPEATMAFSPREAMRLPSETIPVEDSEGRICLDFCAKYPPGAPILCPGERISGQAKALLARMGITRAKVAKN